MESTTAVEWPAAAAAADGLGGAPQRPATHVRGRDTLTLVRLGHFVSNPDGSTAQRSIGPAVSASQVYGIYRCTPSSHGAEIAVTGPLCARIIVAVADHSMC